MSDETYARVVYIITTTADTLIQNKRAHIAISESRPQIIMELSKAQINIYNNNQTIYRNLK